MKFAITIICLFLNIILFANEPVSFFDFVAADGSGIEILQKLQEERAEKKEVYTTHDTTNDVCELVELVTVLLDEAVMQKVRV